MGHAHARASRERNGSEAAAPAHRAVVPALGLQQTAGNQAVAALIAGAQAKLRVGAVDDPLEQEADEVAEAVARTIRSGDLTASPLDPHDPTVRRSASAAGVGRAGGELGTETESALRSAKAGGRPLPDLVRAPLEQAFSGADFGAVRTHEGPASTALNDAVGARAFTVGSDIFFRDSVPGPADPLLAHELTHVVQQGAATTGLQRKATTTTEQETESTAFGEVTTATTTKQVGTSTENKQKSDSFDGTTQRTSSVEESTLVGAETVVKIISRSSATEIEKAVEVMARAGAFGESSRKAAISRGAVSASAEGSAKGYAGVEASAKGGVTVSANLYHALVAVMEAAVQAGVGGSLEGKLTAGLGPLAASVSGKLEAFAGAMASVKGGLDVGITHIKATIEAEAFAGVKGEASTEVKLELGGVEANAMFKAEAMAGVKAAGEAELSISLDGIALSAKAEAFAGVAAKVSGETGLGYRGRSIFSAKGEVSVSAGVGGEASATFELKNGKLKLGGSLAGTLGIGGGVDVDIEIDFYALSYMIVDLIARAYAYEREVINRNSPKVERTPIIDPDLAAKKVKAGHDAYLADFKAYDAKKAKQGDSGIKRERIQDILDKRWSANKEEWQFLEFDEGIVAAAKEAFGPKLGLIMIQAGQIRAFEVERTAEQKAHLKKERTKKGLKF